MTLIVSFGDRFHAQTTPEVSELIAYTSFVAGMHDRPTRTAHDGRQLGVQIRLDPLGAFWLFSLPMHRPVPSPEVAWAWRTMRRASGAVRVADLASAPNAATGTWWPGSASKSARRPRPRRRSCVTNGPHDY